MTDFNPSLPYNDLPSLPPSADLVETTEILKRCIKARVALAELKQAAELIPNSAVLVNALPLLEARASSEIENIVTTTDKLFEFADIAEDRADDVRPCIYCYTCVAQAFFDNSVRCAINPVTAHESTLANVELERAA